MNDRTMTFSIGDQTEQIIRNTLMQVYDALKEKGYNPINQIVGYKIDRDTLLQSLVKYYLSA